MTNNKNKSFTLIEILVVIIIIGLLASLILFSTNDAFEQQKRMEVLNFSNSTKGKMIQSLLSEWTFDGPTAIGSNATNNDVKDSWKYNHGDVTGHVPVVKGGDDCISGKCLQFNSSGLTYVDIPYNYAFDFGTGDFTVSAWIKTSNVLNYQTIFARDYNSTGNGVILYTNINNGFLRTWVGGTALNGTINICNDKWNYVLVTRRTAGALKIVDHYINGSFNSSVNATGNVNMASNNKIRLGVTDQATPGYKFSGLIDDVRVYNTTLSSFQIKQNYIAGLDLLLGNNAISKEEYGQRILNLAQHE